MTDNEAKTGPVVPPDPIYQTSYSLKIALASIALVGSVALVIADEAFFRRGYKGVQRKQAEVMMVYLDSLTTQRQSVEDTFKALDEYRDLDLALRAAEEAGYAQQIVAQDEFKNLDAEGTALSAALKVPNSKISALTYSIEHHTHGAGEHDALTSDAGASDRAAIQEILGSSVDSGFTWTKLTRKAEFTTPVRYTAKDPEVENEPKLLGTIRKPEFDSEEQTITGSVAELQKRFRDVIELKGNLQRQVGQIVVAAGEARKRRDRWLDMHMRDIGTFLDETETKCPADATPEQQQAFETTRAQMRAKLNQVGASVWLRDYSTNLDSKTVASLRDRFAKMPSDPVRQGDIDQIYVREANWVDRCTTCHVGTLLPVPVTTDLLTDALKAADWSESKIESYPLNLMTSHPRSTELFAHHDPEKVGCSTCHNGNGVAVTSVAQAHGTNKHWLWPLYPKENIEAGCLQCHQGDIRLAGGERISSGRQTFLEKGCWGCHPYAGHDPEPEAINSLNSRLKDLRRSAELKLQRADQLRTVAGCMSNDELNSAGATANKLEQQDLRAQVGQIELEAESLTKQLGMRWSERQRVGPNLKDLRAKLRPEILFDWVKNPSSVRLDTKMPAFRFKDDEEVKDVVAFLWQSALSPQSFPEYDLKAPSGGNAARGRQLFTTSTGKGCLSCHAIEDEESKQIIGSHRAANLTNLGDKDRYEYVYRWIKNPKHRIVPYSVTAGLDLTAAEAAKEDPASLVTAQPTMMPDFRLSDEDARDIATYLVSRKSGKWTETPNYLEDKDRAERGKAVVLYLGCAGCHEIKGLENEKGIGRELTTEGSQALDRLDFGHFTIDAQRGEEDPLAEWETQKDGVKLFGDGKPWYRPRGFFMHKLAKPDVYEGAKYLPDRFTRLRMPQFRWAAQEIHDLTTFLLGSVEPVISEKIRYRPDTDQQAIREGWWVVKKHNCEGCHSFEPNQVPSIWSMPWFAENVDMKAPKLDIALPPTLVGAGARIRPEFLAQFLHDPSLGGGTASPVSTRKHLNLRMPTFALSDAEIAKLVRFFAAMAKQPSVYLAEVVPPFVASEQPVADAVFASASCFTCHPKYVAGKPLIEGETKAPDLTYAHLKLRPEWTRRWLRNPAALIPFTGMAANFVELPAEHRWVKEDNQRPELGAYKGDHIDLTLRYLFHEYWRNPNSK